MEKLNKTFARTFKYSEFWTWDLSRKVQVEPFCDVLAPGPVLPDSDRAHSVLLKQFCVCKLSQTFVTRLLSDSIDQLLSCSVLIVCGLVLVQPETINSPSFSFIPDHLAQPIRDVLLDPRGQVNLVPVLFLLSLVLVIFLISFLGCLGTCLHSRCMIFTVSF